LTDKAKPYKLGTNVDSIFATVLARFGLSGIDARVHLQGLRRDPRTPLQEHNATVKRKTAHYHQSD